MTDAELLNRLKQEWEARRRGRQAAFAGRLAKLYAQHPEIKQLEQERNSLVPNAVLSTLGDPAARTRALQQAREEQAALTARLEAFLRERGFDASDLLYTPVCTRCGDTGMTEDGLCACLQKAFEAKRRENLSSVLPLHRFSDFQPDILCPEIDPEAGFSQRQNMLAVKRYCEKWTRNFGSNAPNLFLSGGAGQGKTFLCACMADALLRRDVSVVYDTAGHIFSTLEDIKFDRGEPDREAGKRLTRCDLLILDDLGSEMTTSFVISALYDLINTRLTTGRKTILSSNLGYEDLEDRYTPAIVSRIHGEFELVFFFGPDLRLSKKDAKGFYV